MVGKEEVGPRAADRGEGFEDGSLPVEPAPRSGGLDHGVLAAYAERGKGKRHAPAGGAQDIEVRQGRVHHDYVRPFSDIQVDLAQRFAAVGGVELVPSAVAKGRGRTRGFSERPVEGR